jgi:hypothetical protein
MARNKSTEGSEETALAVNASAGLMDTSMDEFAGFVGDGFASIDSVLLGDPEDGKQTKYMGELIGPGADIEMEADQKTGEVRSMRSWAFHPMSKTENGSVGVVRNVTHIIPSSYQIHAACSRIFETCQREKKTAIVALIYAGQTKTRKGYRLNQYRVFEKYV